MADLVPVTSMPPFGGVYEGRRILVTGHTGFKGSWLTEWLLALGAVVTGYALEPPTDPNMFEELGLASRIRHVIGDVRDLDHLRVVVQESRPEMIFHLAAQPLVRASYADPVSTYGTNVMGTVNVLEAARTSDDVRVVVVVTSDKCYENAETGRAYREDDPMGGYDPYSSSKGCAELVTAAYRRSFFGEQSVVRIASVRAGNVIGGGDWAVDRIVPDCVRALERGEPVLVRNPNAVRPWQHVLEPLGGYLHLAARLWSGDRSADGAWNFGPADDQPVTVRALVEGVIAAWGAGEWRTPASTADAPHEAGLLALDIGKAGRLLGWRPLYDTERAVAITAEWYRARHEGAAVRDLVEADIAAYVREAQVRHTPWCS